MSVQEMGQRIAAWAAPLGFESASAAPENCVIHSRGGETRWHVWQQESEYIVTCSQRAHAEAWFAMSSSSLDDVERYIVGTIGAALRAELSPAASRVALFVRIPELADPFTYVPAPDDPRRGVLQENGKDRARFGSYKNALHAVRFSQYANAAVEDLKRAYLAPDGSPLFSVDPSQPSA